MKLAELNQVYEEDVEDEQDPDDDDDFEESTEADLTTALNLLETAMLLFDELIDDRLNGKNRIAYKMGERIHQHTTEVWAFLQPFQTTDDTNDADKDVVEGV